MDKQKEQRKIIKDRIKELKIYLNFIEENKKDVKRRIKKLRGVLNG